MEYIKKIAAAKTIGISGHVRPDGDCIGAAMGLYLYLKKTFPSAVVHVYLEKPAEIFNCMESISDIHSDFISQADRYDVFFALDTVKERMGPAEAWYDQAGFRINIDHHISNPGCGDLNRIDPEAGSTCELIYDFIGGKNSLDGEIAKAIYIGMIHDTGVFSYSNTTPRTLRIAAELIAFGFDFPQLITETFYEKTFVQNQLLGRVVMESKVFIEGRCIVSILDRKTMEFYGVKSGDMDGIVNQLLITKGVEWAIFMYQTGTDLYKVSLRSKGLVDVSQIASYFGGGGHVRAAGVTMSGTPGSIIRCLTEAASTQLE